MDLRPALGAISIAIAGAVLESVFAGRGIRKRLASIRQPAASPPLALWAVIGLLYYATCFAVAYRLLEAGLAGGRAAAFGLLVAVMLGNAYWNYAFFRRGDLRLTLLVTAGYALAAVGLLAVLIAVDRTAASLLTPYLIYLVYGTWWAYAVWRLNSAPRRA